MSKSEIKAVTCPVCGTSGLAELWVSVNSADRTLREKVKTGQFFRWQCEICGQESSLAYPCLYRDTDHKFMLLLQYTPRKLYPGLSMYRKRIVRNANEMREKLFIFEAGLNDMAVQLTKQALSKVISSEQAVPVSTSYFAGLDESDSHISFYFFPGRNAKPLFRGTKIEAYLKSLEIVGELAAETETCGEFLRIDGNWAEKVMKQHLGEEI